MNYSIIEINRDMTERISLRKGDYLIWYTWSSIWGNPKDCIKINDVWELQDGDFITITNRYEDLPGWLELFPTEVQGILVNKLLDKFNKGEYPAQPVDACNVWRVKSGDKIACIHDSEHKIYSINENSFVIGDNSKDTENLFLNFGALTNYAMHRDAINVAREIQDYICQLGLPRTFATEWRIG